jgi:hypothetical protein
MYGEYYDGKRTYRPIKRQPPEPQDMPDETTAGLIREAIGRYPKATAEEIHIFVKELEDGPEFDVKAIRAVMHFGQ